MRFTGCFARGLVVAALILALGAAAGAKDTKITKKEVPAAVLAAFEKSYPKATAKGFSKEVENGQTLYEIESVEGAMTRDIIYSADGKALEIEEGMDAKDLPAEVQQAVEKKFPKAQIRKAEKYTKGSFRGYEIKVTTAAKKNASAIFDVNGKEAKP